MQWPVIPPEIKDDELYHYMIQLVRRNVDIIHNILEIGASSGEGSTEALMQGKMGTDIRLFSLEVARERFEPLRRRYADDPNFFPYNYSSIDVANLMSERDIADYFNNIQAPNTPASILSPLSVLYGWRNNDINYVRTNGIPQNGILQIKKDHGIAFFDLVLIDGSEFAGNAEFDLIYGAKFIVLDDIRTYKNSFNEHRLSRDPNYVCIRSNPNLRNGYSVYMRWGAGPQLNQLGVFDRI